jgi:multidrug efflux system membrane fusion protein
MSLRFSIVIVFVATACALCLSACGHGGDAHGMPVQGVSVASVLKKKVSEWATYSGRMEAVESVEVRPRIQGYLQGVHFQEGSIVKKGDLLFTIDDREYRVAVDSARAGIARVQARIGVAKTELQRTQQLLAAQAASIEEQEQRSAEVEQATADLQLAQAQLKQAELNLDFTRIKAPIDGRISRAEIRPGNLVSPSTSVLTTIVSIDPIEVGFDADQRLLDFSSKGEQDALSATVMVGLSESNDFIYTGELTFVDNQVNPATGTLRGKATLMNKSGLFTPGLFARVRIKMHDEKEALLIHERAILTDQDHKYVYVLQEKVEENKTVRKLAIRKDVQLGASIDGLRVVLDGLSENDQIVVNGTRKIFMSGQDIEPAVVPMEKPETDVSAEKKPPNS